MGQVKGRKKRRELVWALAAEWNADISAEPDESRADRKAIYRRMGGIMKPALINAELAALEKTGWVVLREDAVWVGKRGAQGGTEELSEDDNSRDEAAAAAEETGTPEHEDAVWAGRRGVKGGSEELREDDNPHDEAAKAAEETGTPEHEECRDTRSGSDKRKRDCGGDNEASGERSVEARTGKRRKKGSGGDAGALGADRVLRERPRRKRVTVELSSGGEEDDDEEYHNSGKKQKPSW